MTTFTDDFNRADSSSLGAGWVEVSGDWSIVSNQLSPGNTGGTIILRAAGAMATNDNYAQITIAATTAASQGVWCRGNANITSGYLFRNDGTTWVLFSVVGGSFTQIGSFSAAAVPGDVAKVQANGSTIKCFTNGVERISVTDTAVTTGTSVGVRSESTSSLRYDDFTGSDMAVVVSGSAATVFGGLNSTATGVRTVIGSAGTTFGGLVSTAHGGAPRAASATGSWGPLLDMAQEAADWVRAKQQEPPAMCPNDFTPLAGGPDGTLYCPWVGDYVWPGDGRQDL